jgi:2-iminoacetate synthase ThiH
MYSFVNSEWTIRIGHVFFNLWWYLVQACCASDGVACISLALFSSAADFDIGIHSGEYVQTAETDNRVLVVQTTK